MVFFHLFFITILLAISDTTTKQQSRNKTRRVLNPRPERRSTVVQALSRLLEYGREHEMRAGTRDAEASRVQVHFFSFFFL